MKKVVAMVWIDVRDGRGGVAVRRVFTIQYSLFNIHYIVFAIQY